MMMVEIWWIVLLSFLLPSLSQDYDIHGLFTSYTSSLDTLNVQTIYSKCVKGLGFETCNPKLPTDIIELDAMMDYYKDLASQYGATYCLQCCGDQANFIDTWDLYCDVDTKTASLGNVYGYELRLARNQDSTDSGYVRCPLRRSACKYNEEGETLSCDRSSDNTYLIGYTAKITVHEYSANFKFWRGASHCSITSYESPWPLNASDTFHETIIMNYSPSEYPNYSNYSKYLFLLLFLIIVIVGLLYFCRRKRCVYCQQKLVFSYSLCIKCRLVGAQPPDPVLLRMMEEKGVHLQGEIPEPFPGVKAMCKCLSWCCCFAGCCRGGQRKIGKAKIVPTTRTTRDEESKTRLEEQSTNSLTNQEALDGAEEGSSSPRKEKGKKGKSWFNKKENPNILPYDESIIGAAVGHRDYKVKPTAKTRSAK
eukprot:scaffold1431_cov167-Ochromonas_danica.AAC.8